ncbi:tRNA pseudouridine(38-40) synthase TruA [Terrarubrum flagellatum]|uniref:tRNA pseudouridine(38-40) synthase TruA n=1 Tax=Terrirubrum flagellatum TaxID=2895980 RepID=UPI003144F7DD
MPRFKLIIEYDGGAYAGWQSQANARAVQDALEDALERMSGERPRLTAAGRTDAGVHALHQVAHADLKKEWRPGNLRDGLNAHLKLMDDLVSVIAIERVDEEFDARFRARKRHYLYRISNRRAPPTLDKTRVWHIPRKLNSDTMHEAAQVLIGRHDFTTFRATHCQAKSPVKTLDRLDVIRKGDDIEVFASSRSFLHNQVRSMVGSLVEVGLARWTRDDLRAALDAKDRKRCGQVAPPQGLYLIGVDYA